MLLRCAEPLMPKLLNRHSLHLSTVDNIFATEQASKFKSINAYLTHLVRQDRLDGDSSKVRRDRAIADSVRETIRLAMA